MDQAPLFTNSFIGYVSLATRYSRSRPTQRPTPGELSVQTVVHLFPRSNYRLGEEGLCDDAAGRKGIKVQVARDVSCDYTALALISGRFSNGSFGRIKMVHPVVRRSTKRQNKTCGNDVPSRVNRLSLYLTHTALPTHQNMRWEEPRLQEF